MANDNEKLDFLKLAKECYDIAENVVKEGEVTTYAEQHFTSEDASIKNSMITEGCRVYGNVEHSVLFSGVTIGKGAVVKDSVILPNTRIEDGAVVEYAIIGQETVIGAGAKVGCSKEEAMATVQPGPMAGYMAVIGDEITVGENQIVKAGEMLAQDRN